MTQSSRPLSANIVSAEEALLLASSDRHVLFLDVRFSPKQQDLRSEYDVEHISGAHFVDLKTQLQGKGGGVAGSRPLPDVSNLQRNIALWGITPETVVIVYAKGTPAAAARAWFVLKWAGLSNVRHLDGGIAAWKRAGGNTDDRVSEEGGGTYMISKVGRLSTLTADDIAGYIGAGGKVFDARGAAEFSGDGSVRSGHIQGAGSLPATTLLDAEGLLLEPDAVRSIIEARGAADAGFIGVYCGGGVGGALETLALETAGIDARLFVGSFSAWAADPDRAVAQGLD